ncbi:GNAT family N-acetyltransferase [Microbacterium amylolyticum]|nr:GNAT family N-acetyltransferase [Microbacterium amylolyticum]
MISRADFADPQLRVFLEAHLADLEPTAPPESQHALDFEALQRPGVRLWVAADDGVIVGTAALSVLDDHHDELKSMRTEPACRGTGIASQLLEHATGDARSRNVARVSLETGSDGFFAPARRFYARHGFSECAPFGAYRPDPNSVFMTRVLA